MSAQAVATEVLSSSSVLPPFASAHTAGGQDFEVIPFNAGLGAEIVGIDLGKPLSVADFARVHRAHLDHHVLVFRDQRITPQQHIDFSRRFGKLMIHVLHQFHLANHPEILIVSNIVEDGKPVGLGDAGKYWHSDISYKPLPSLGSLLHAQELPAEGGDTLFANMHTAYETLPAEIKAAIDGKVAVHSYLAKYDDMKKAANWRPTLSAEQLAQVKAVSHPAVRTHPETGRRALFVSEGFTTHIEGLPEDESRDLLNQLFAHSTKDEFIYRHQWREHDLVFWDNRSLIHLAAGCPTHLRRKLFRTTIEGDLPY